MSKDIYAVFEILRKHPHYLKAPNLSGVLPDWAIEYCIEITPLAKAEKRPGVISYGLTSYGYDARLGTKAKAFDPMSGFPLVDPKNIQPGTFRDLEGDYFIIPPNSYLLGETVETFHIPRDVLVLCVGKSTYARCGIIVNVTPLEPEWKGKVTLEISNSSPLPAKVYANEGICQFVFFMGMGMCDRSYADKAGVYQNQEGLTLPKVERHTMEAPFIPNVDNLPKVVGNDRPMTQEELIAAGVQSVGQCKHCGRTIRVDHSKGTPFLPEVCNQCDPEWSPKKL